MLNNKQFIESGLLEYFKKSPISYIDIGARGGAHDSMESIAAITSVLGFEPNKEECSRLLQLDEVTSPWHSFMLEPIALSCNDGLREFYEVIEPNNSSLYEPNSNLVNRYKMDKWRVIGKSQTVVTSLDNLYKNKYQYHREFCEMIKIDTQGSEYEILEGGRNLITNNTIGILTEVSFCHLYKNQKLFSDVERLLRSYGLTFYGFTAQHYRSCKLIDKKEYPTKERIIYADAIFFRDPFDISSSAFSARQASVLFTLLLVYGFYDFALELAIKQDEIKCNFIEEERAKLLILSLSKASPLEAASRLEKVYQESLRDPNNSNAIVGNFIKTENKLCNYDDILNISPLPKNY